MSINELTIEQYKQHTFNQAYSNDVIKDIKKASDIKNDTDNLTFSESVTNSSHGTYAKLNRDRKVDLNIEHLSRLDVCGPEYYEGLLGGSNGY